MNHAIVTLDETGSMSGQERRVVTSLNEYVNQLPKNTRLAMFKFDSERWTEFFRGMVEKWKPMKEKDYRVFKIRDPLSADLKFLLSVPVEPVY